MIISDFMVTGTRSPSDKTKKMTKLALEWVARSPLTTYETFLFQGAAAGVDSIAKNTWNLHRRYDIPFKANWHQYGKRAGPIRNQQMVDAEPQICLAFPSIESVGTWDAAQRAKNAGIRVFILQDRDSMYEFYCYLFQITPWKAKNR